MTLTMEKVTLLRCSHHQNSFRHVDIEPTLSKRVLINYRYWVHRHCPFTSNFCAIPLLFVWKMFPCIYRCLNLRFRKMIIKNLLNCNIIAQQSSRLQNSHQCDLLENNVQIRRFTIFAKVICILRQFSEGHR